MKISVISFSLTGKKLGDELAESLSREGYEAAAVTKCSSSLDCIEESLSGWTEKQFKDKGAGAIVFISSCGIAVRAVAPFIVSKSSDPAVLVMDEMGNYVISLLSGHLGGANELAEKIGALTGAVPVITTATDIHGRWAVDVFAKKNNCVIGDLKKIKVISAAVLSGEEVGYMSVMPSEGRIPCGVKYVAEEDREKPKPAKGIVVSPYISHGSFFDETLQLFPRCLTIGIGCKKGISRENIEDAVNAALKGADLDIRSAAEAASIDLKAEEPGLVAYCSEMGLPFRTYSAEELLRAEGDFTSSEFVREVTGVDNVCERSAAAGAGETEGNGEVSLIVKKFKGSGVTVAVAIKKGSVNFE